MNTKNFHSEQSQSHAQLPDKKHKVYFAYALTKNQPFSQLKCALHARKRDAPRKRGSTNPEMKGLER